MELEQWMEEDRIQELDRDVSKYEKEMSDRYPQSFWEASNKSMERQKKKYSSKGLKTLGVFIVAEIIIVSGDNNFFSGVLAVVVLIIFVHLSKEHTKYEPDWARCSDPRSDEDIKRGGALDMRLNNPGIDRENWLAKYQPPVDDDY